MENKNFLMFTLVIMSTLLMLQTFNMDKEVNNQKTEEISITEEQEVKSDIHVPEIKNDAKLEFSTDSLSGQINLSDGSIENVYLKKYNRQMKEKTSFGWINKLKIAEINESDWIVKENNQDKIVIAQKSQSLQKERTFKFKDEYLIEITDKVHNITNNPQNYFPYSSITQKDLSELDDSFLNHEGAVLFTGKALKEFDYSVIDNNPSTITDNSKWLGFAHRFWLTSLIQRSDKENTVQIKKNKYYTAGFIDFKEDIISPEQGKEKTMLLYVGPKDAKVLSEYEEKYNIPSFSGVVNWGWLFFATKPLYYSLNWLIENTDNAVLSIFLIVIILKVILFPISYKGQIISEKMQKISPEIEEIKKKYSNDMPKMSQEISKLYEKNDINILVSILPLFLQIPILFAVYRIMYMCIGLKDAHFLWIKDLSAPDSLNLLSFIGSSSISISILGILAAFSMMLQIMTTGKQAMDTGKATGISVVVSFLVSGLPAAALIYMIINGAITFIQQIIIKKLIS